MIEDLARALRGGPQAPRGLTTWNGSDPAQRFGVYRNNVALALRGALSANFPLVTRLVGEECFAALARAYIESSPPRARRLALYGAQLGDFIESLAPLAQWPYLGDMARLEVERLSSFHAADANALDAGAVFACADVANARIALHPGVRVFFSRYAVVSLTQRLEADETLETLVWDAPETALLTRQASGVRIVALDPAQAAFVDAARRGATLLDAAQAGASRDPGFDAGSYFGRLVRDRLVVGLKQEGSAP